jgi:hypothetical protein
MNPVLSSAGPFVAPENGNGNPHRGWFAIEEAAMRLLANKYERPPVYRKAVAGYVALVRIANLEGRDEFIRRIQSIATDCGYSYTETMAALRLVEKVGLCEIVERREDGGTTSLPSLYRLKRVSPDFKSPSIGNHTTHTENHARLRVIQPSSIGARDFQESPRVPKNYTKELTKPSTKQAPKGDVVVVEDVVEALYELYPRKVSRGKALNAIRNALTKTDAETIRAALVLFVAKVNRELKPEHLVASPVTWFDEERWKDHRPRQVALAVHVPQPSKALTDLRWVFGRSKEMTEQEKKLAHGYIDQLTESDAPFLTQEEIHRPRQPHRQVRPDRFYRRHRRASHRLTLPPSIKTRP